MDRFHKTAGRGGRTMEPLQPSTEMACEALRACIPYVACTSENVSAWLPQAFDRRGEPVWISGNDFDDWRDDGLVPLQDVLSTADGLIDLGAWQKGELRVIAPTPRWFSPFRSPVRLPLADVRKALAADAGNDEQVQMMQLVESLCPQWLRFVEWQFDAGEDEGESLRAQQRWWGYCLTSDTRLQKMMWNQGDPGQGKGTHVDVYVGVAGEEAMAQTDIDSLAERFDIASLVGRRVCYIPEVRVGDRNTALALNRLLALSANDRVSVEDKFAKKRQGVRLNIKFWLTPNVEPRLHDDSVAILRRLIVNPITRAQPKAVDPFLAERLKSARSLAGVLLWAMIGNRDLRNDLAAGGQGLMQPERGKSILRDIEMQSSPVRAYLSECCLLGPKFSVASDVLLHDWNEYAKSNGYKEMNAASFGKALRASAKDYDRSYEGSRGNRLWVYHGLRPILPGEDREQWQSLPANVDEWLRGRSQAQDGIPFA